MAKMTEEQKKTYLEKGGIRCPFCYSTKLFCSVPETKDDCIEMEIVCEECSKIWTDVYTLTDVCQPY